MFFPRYVLFTTFETGDDEHNPHMPQIKPRILHCI